MFSPWGVWYLWNVRKHTLFCNLLKATLPNRVESRTRRCQSRVSDGGCRPDGRPHKTVLLALSGVFPTSEAAAAPLTCKRAYFTNASMGLSIRLIPRMLQCNTDSILRNIIVFARWPLLKIRRQSMSLSSRMRIVQASCWSIPRFPQCLVTPIGPLSCRKCSSEFVDCRDSRLRSLRATIPTATGPMIVHTTIAQMITTNTSWSPELT